MSEPLNALIISIIIIVILMLVFWPKMGFFWQLKTGRQNKERILMEDALKQLFDHEYINKPCTLRSISGALQMGLDSTAHVLNKLMSLSLAEFADSKFKLTPEGKKYALRIIRTHRLWERYLADETGTAEEDWHREAELREHLLSPDQAEEIASQMGFPSFDPHGDPIPTIAGDLPPKKGIPLINFEVGHNVRIVHIEDEPDNIYAQLVAEGLYPGMFLNIIEKTAQKIAFVADGDEIVLAPIVANNISVVVIPDELIVEATFDSLADLNNGETGEVISISKACRGAQRRRLMDLGVIPGSEITAEFSSAAANPVAYNIKGALIALRDDQARFIKIKKVVTV